MFLELFGTDFRKPLVPINNRFPKAVGNLGRESAKKKPTWAPVTALEAFSSFKPILLELENT
jgi:hypothetical protein